MDYQVYCRRGAKYSDEELQPRVSVGKQMVWWVTAILGHPIGISLYWSTTDRVRAL